MDISPVAWHISLQVIEIDPDSQRLEREPAYRYLQEYRREDERQMRLGPSPGDATENRELIREDVQLTPDIQ